jgi:RND family efflux transporter MFP subunit
VNRYCSITGKRINGFTVKAYEALKNYSWDGNVRELQNEINALMAYSHIRAPFSGVITSKSVKMGDMAKPGHNLMSLEAPGNFVANVMVPETSIEFVKKGQPVMVYVKSTGSSLEGKVSEVSKSSINSGGQYQVKIDLDQTREEKLFSGMYVSSVFPVEGAGSKNLFVDKAALVTRGELDGIYTVSESGTAILRWLKLGQEMGDQIEVLSGIKAGEEYIVSNEGKLYNGVRITKQ